MEGCWAHVKIDSFPPQSHGQSLESGFCEKHSQYLGLLSVNRVESAVYSGQHQGQDLGGSLLEGAPLSIQTSYGSGTLMSWPPDLRQTCAEGLMS